MKKRYIWILTVIALACGSAANAQQIYPNRAVRLVVFVPPGGAADLLARIMAQKLGDAFGQTFLVDNRPGGGGVQRTRHKRMNYLAASCRGIKCSALYFSTAASCGVCTLKENQRFAGCRLAPA